MHQPAPRLRLGHGQIGYALAANVKQINATELTFGFLQYKESSLKLSQRLYSNTQWPANVLFLVSVHTSDS